MFKKTGMVLALITVVGYPGTPSIYDACTPKTCCQSILFHIIQVYTESNCILLQDVKMM